MYIYIHIYTNKNYRAGRRDKGGRQFCHIMVVVFRVQIAMALKQCFLRLVQNDAFAIRN